MKLSGPIGLNVVQAFRGAVDFYYWKGIPVARRWPRPSRQPGTTAQQQTWTNMKLMHSIIRALPWEWKLLWKYGGSKTGFTAQDKQRKTILWLISAGVYTPPPAITGILPVWIETDQETEIQITIKNYSGYDPNAVKFIAKPVASARDRLPWYNVQDEVNRQRYVQPFWHPALTDFQEALDTTYDATKTVYYARYAGQSTFWLVAAKPIL